MHQQPTTIPMDKYRLVGERRNKPEHATASDDACEVRITQQGKPRNYISYAMNLFVSCNFDWISSSWILSSRHACSWFLGEGSRVHHTEGYGQGNQQSSHNSRDFKEENATTPNKLLVFFWNRWHIRTIGRGSWYSGVETLCELYDYHIEHYTGRNWYERYWIPGTFALLWNFHFYTKISCSWICIGI